MGGGKDGSKKLLCKWKIIYLIIHGEVYCLAQFIRTETLVIYTEVYYAGTFVFHARGLF